MLGLSQVLLGEELAMPIMSLCLQATSSAAEPVAMLQVRIVSLLGASQPQAEVFR